MEQKKRRGAKWWLFRIAAFFVCVYVVLVLIRVRGLFQEEETQKQVEKIHSIRLTQSDVDGTKRPPVPDQAINNSTIEGVDSNENYIRDDVELYILDAYTNLNERSAWLQWAKNNQVILLLSNSKEAYKAAAQELGRAGACVVSVYKNLGTKPSWEILKEEMNKIEGFVFNNESRAMAVEEVFKNDSSFSGGRFDAECDLPLM